MEYSNNMPTGYSSMQGGLSQCSAIYIHHFCKSCAIIPTSMHAGHPPKNGDIPLDINKMSLLQPA